MLNRRLEQIRSRAEDTDITELIRDIHDLRDTLHFWLKRISLDKLTDDERACHERAYKLSRGDV